MTAWLLDTNVISELRKPSPHRGVSRWISEQARLALYTSSVNLAEIRFGIVSQTDELRRQRLQGWLEEHVRPLFEDRILGATEEAILQWRIFAHQADRNRQPAPSADLLIAAIAAVNGISVASRDVMPFAGAGVAVLNPWNGERFNGA